MAPADLSPWRWLAAAAALTVTAAHVPVTAEHLSEAPYIGWSFVALEIVAAVLAVWLVLRADRAVWLAAGCVAALAIVAYVVTRLFSLPQIGDDVGNWTDPLGVVALVAEAALFALAVWHPVRSPTSSWLMSHPIARAFTALVVGLVSTACATRGGSATGERGAGQAAHHTGSMLPPLHWGSLGTHWHMRPWWLLFSWVVLSGYLAAVAIARRHRVPGVHPVRVASFVAGIVLLLFTVSSALDTYAMALFWVHMIEHLLLIMVIPALLVIGHPLSAVRAAASAYGEEGVVDSFARSRPVLVLAHPAVGLGLYSAVIVGTHLTGFMDAMTQHPWLMSGEQWLYLLTGYVYFLPLLGAEPIHGNLPYLARPALILFGMTPDTVVGIVLMQATYTMFPLMHAGHPGWAPGALEDQYLGGAVMWVAGDGLMMLFGVGVVLAIISHSRSGNMLGRRLEGIRRHTMSEHLALAGDAVPLDAHVDVDNDDAAFEAYNKMLARMSGQCSQPR